MGRLCVSARRPRMSVFVVAFVCALLAALASAPATAHAEQRYTCPSVTIDATVEADGSLSVVETREFSFDGDFSAVWWTFGSMPSSECELAVESAVLSTPDGQDASLNQALPEADFEVAWREAGGPDAPAYSVDASRDVVYVFFDADGADVSVTLSYSINDFVQAYSDVAELRWQFVSGGWGVASDHVVATVHVPAPAGYAVGAGEAPDVRAWAHGADGVSASVGGDGAVSLSAPSVAAGSSAEARVTFPSSWLTSLSPASSAVHSGDRLDTVIDEESRLANQASAQRLRSLALIVGCLAASLAIIAWALIAFFRHGRELKPAFQDAYWRETPDASLHPAVVGRLWNWGECKNDEFAATLMHLSRIGALRVDVGCYERPTVRGGVETAGDYYLTRLAGWEDKVAASPIDKAAMELVFDAIGGGQDSVWLGRIGQCGKEHPRELADAMAAWRRVVDAEAGKQDFFEAKGAMYQGIMTGASIVGLVAAAAWSFSIGSIIPLVALAPAFAVLFVVSRVMSRRSRRAVELHAKCEALRTWLKDFGALDESLPADASAWGDLMVCAFIFGVGDEALHALQARVPEVASDPAFVPVAYWMIPHDVGAETSTLRVDSPLSMVSAAWKHASAKAGRIV